MVPTLLIPIACHRRDSRHSLLSIWRGFLSLVVWGDGIVLVKVVKIMVTALRCCRTFGQLCLPAVHQISIMKHKSQIPNKDVGVVNRWLRITMRYLLSLQFHKCFQQLCSDLTGYFFHGIFLSPQLSPAFSCTFPNCH